MKSMLIREATGEDVPTVSAIHVASWQVAYKGLVPDQFLADLKPKDREGRHLESLSDPSTNFWVIEDEGEILGFTKTGPSLDPNESDTTGEVYAIYLRPGAWDKGYGRMLFDHAVKGLEKEGYQELILWVLRGNERARRFYEAAGWSADGVEKQVDWDGVLIDEVRYRKVLAVVVMSRLVRVHRAGGPLSKGLPRPRVPPSDRRHRPPPDCVSRLRHG